MYTIEIMKCAMCWDKLTKKDFTWFQNIVSEDHPIYGLASTLILKFADDDIKQLTGFEHFSVRKLNYIIL